MNKKSLWLITALMIFALIGVFVMQVFYIRQAYRLKSEIFDQNVNAALSTVAERVQKRNAVVHIRQKRSEINQQKESNIRGHTEKIVGFREKFRQNDEQRKLRQQEMRDEYLLSQDKNIRNSYMSPLIISEREFQQHNNKDVDVIEGLKLLVLNIPDARGQVVERKLLQTFPRPDLAWLIRNNRVPDTLRYVAIDPNDLLPRLISLPGNDKDLDAKFKIEDANAKLKFQMELNELYADTLVVSKENKDFLEDVQKEMQSADVPLSQRVSQTMLDTLIKTELQNKGITAAYSFWLRTTRNDSLVFIRASQSDGEILPANTHFVTLFNKDVIRDPGLLYVNFPNESAAIFSGMGVTLGSSFAFLLLLVFIFTYTIYAIIRQKKISEMKSDFINNMTHEFKTPVATIMLASEALKDKDVLDDSDRVRRLAGIIYDENIRLGNHIERVLSIARIENKELQLEKNSVNVHDIITAVTDSMSLQLQQKNAVVTLQLAANDPNLITDELHLSNIIFNLIDNANKYSKEAPQITISTKNVGNRLIIEVADKGIGMTKEQTKRIFDQFYRVPTGNLHDVKGFGLGLNYVQDIVEEMGGTVKVQSEKDKGSVFEVSF